MHKTFLIFVERINNAIGNCVICAGAESDISVLRSGKFFTANCKNLKYVSNLVGRKQIWCGEGQNFNSLAIGRIGTDGLRWSTSKNMTTKINI